MSVPSSLRSVVAIDTVDLGTPDGHPHLAWLGPVRAQHLEFLHWASSTQLGPFWRTRGMTMSPDAFAREVFGDDLCQLLAFGGDHPSPVGWFTVFSADLAAGHAELAVARMPGASSLVWADGLERFLSHVFATWTIETLHVQLPEPTWSSLGAPSRGLVEEVGRRRDYYVFRGRRHDQVLGELRQEAWESSSLRRAVVARRRSLTASTNGHRRPSGP